MIAASAFAVEGGVVGSCFLSLIMFRPFATTASTSEINPMLINTIENSVVRRGSTACFSNRKNWYIVNPNVISEIDVRIHAIIVWSYAARVRSIDNIFERFSSGVLGGV